MEKQESVKVQLMEKFQITYGSHVLDEEIIHSSKGIKLLAFLIFYRKRPASVEELAELFGSGERSAKNPYGFLKNLIYRMRTLLKRLGPEEFLISSYKGYGWNPEIPVEVDVETFEVLCKKAQNTKDGGVRSRKENYEKAAAAYQASIAPILADEHWMVGTTVYYTTLYLNTVRELAGIYEQEKEYEKQIEICRKALKYEPADEDLNYWLMKGLIGQGKREEAIDHYKQAVRIYHERLEDRKADKIRPLYEQLMLARGTESEHIGRIMQQIEIESNAVGACFCDKGIFLHICGIEARRKQRGRGRDSLLLMTLTVDGIENRDILEEFLMKQGKKKLREVLASALRVGDVVTEYSTRQFAALLAACSKEDGIRVAERLIKKFESSYKGQHISISYEMEEFN